MPRPALLALLASAVLASGCGSQQPGDARDGERPRLVVAAAASLTEALTACSARRDDVDVSLSFAGSDELAAQIRQGLRPDVFAAADVALPQRLAAEGLLREAVAFATNELVLAVPSGSAITTVADLARDGVKLAVGAGSVPVGAATRRVLGRLAPDTRRAILANVRSNEPDVKGVVGKVVQGGADAGFVYRSDVRALGGRLERIDLPDRLRPEVTYGAGVVTGAPRPARARAYLDGLVAGPCADALRDAGFGPAPRS